MPTPARVRLLRLAEDVAGEYADLGDPLAQQRLATVVDALAHALVDAADGLPSPTRRLDWPARSDALRRGVVVDGVRSGPDDPASCSSLAARLQWLAKTLSDLPGVEESGAGPLVGRVRRAATGLAGALQDHVVALAAATSTAERAESDRALLRGLGAAYDLLRPDDARP